LGVGIKITAAGNQQKQQAFYEINRICHCYTLYGGKAIPLMTHIRDEIAASPSIDGPSQ